MVLESGNKRAAPRPPAPPAPCVYFLYWRIQVELNSELCPQGSYCIGVRKKHGRHAATPEDLPTATVEMG